MVKELPLRIHENNDEKTSYDLSTEKVTTADDHVTEENDNLRKGPSEDETKTATPVAAIIVDNNRALSENNCGTDSDAKPINNIMLCGFQNFQLSQKALQLDAKLDKENAKNEGYVLR